MTEQEDCVIRSYSEKDKKFVTNLMRELCLVYNVEFNKERWERSLEMKFSNSDATRLFVAESKCENVVGMLVSDIRGKPHRTGYITNLVVAPESRNQGVGESLIRSHSEYGHAA